MDKATTHFERLAYARCFVEILANTPLKNCVHLETEGGDKARIDVEYEWLPPTCYKCHCFGHVDSQCPTKEVWKPKEKCAQENINTEVHSNNQIG